MQAQGQITAVITIRKYENDQAVQAGEPFETVVETQVVDLFPVTKKRSEARRMADLLNEGITALLNLLTGGAETAYSNANAYIGVGDSSTAFAASQTALQAASNKLYKAMVASYPAISGQTVTFRASFGSSEGNFAWNEFTVANGNSDSADNLLRVVSAQGTKASGQTWVVDINLTFS